MSPKLKSLSKSELANRLEESEAKNAQLAHELDLLKRMVFGQKRERFVPEHPPEQLALFGDLEKALETAPEKEQISYERDKPKKRKEKPFRQPIPARFPRKDIFIEPEGDLSGKKKIGEEITEELEYVPPKFIVHRYIRPKYVDPQNEDFGVLIGKMPSRPIDKGIAGPGLLAHLLTAKFVDHLPLYRQVQQFKRIGYAIPRSTLGGWQRKTCELLEPLYQALRRRVLASSYLQADETPIKVLDQQKKGKAHRGYHWVYHTPVERLVLFDYQMGRSSAGPASILRDFKGYLQVDGYVTYEAFEKKQGIFLVSCLAHIRRYFEQALENAPDQAGQMLGWIQELYAVEREARKGTLTFEKRKALRLEKARPVIDQIGEWAVEQQKNPTFLPKEPLGVAFRYLLGRFNYFVRYLEDGRLEIDNNLIENQIRPVALGRKNYLFAGSHSGAKQAAMLYSFLGTCKRNEVEPFEWLSDVLARLPEYPVNRLDELLPQQWKAQREANL